MANFGSNFLRAFNPNFANSFNTSFRFGLSQQEEERQRKELLKAQQEQRGILAQITRGSINAPKFENGKFIPQGVSYPNANNLEMQSQLSSHNYDVFQDWKKENAPKQDKYLAPNLDEDNKYISQWNETTRKMEVTDQPNPNYKPPEETPIWKGEGTVGNKKIYRKIFKNADGTQRVEDIDTGFYKESNSQGKEIERLNLNKYKQTLSLYESKYQKYLTDIADGSEQTNYDLDIAEQEFAMIVAPEVQGEINKYYNRIKDRVGGEIPEGFEYKNRDGLKKTFLSDVEKKYKQKTLDPDDLSYIDGYDQLDNKGKEQLHEEMNAQNYRALKTWANLKFTRL